MKHLELTAVAVLVLLGVVPAQAESRSAELTFPAGSVQLHGVFTGARDLLQHDSTITKLVADQRIDTSDTVYDSVSAVSSATAKSTWTWTLAFRAESDGTVTVAVSHTAAGHRPPRSLVAFARDLAAAVKAAPADVVLELNGVKKPLADWKRS